MFKSIAAKAAIAITAAVLGTGLAVVLTTAPLARAELQVVGTIYQHRGKGDRLPLLAKGTACSLQGWPHYERSCQFDMRPPAEKMRTTRIIALQ